MSRFHTLATMLAAAGVLAACATPQVVQVKQVEDTRLSCADLAEALDEAKSFEDKARQERGVTGKNVAAAVLFWPALAATYINTDDAITASKDRQTHLAKLSEKKGC